MVLKAQKYLIAWHNFLEFSNISAGFISNEFFFCQRFLFYFVCFSELFRAYYLCLDRRRLRRRWKRENWPFYWDGERKGEKRKKR